MKEWIRLLTTQEQRVALRNFHAKVQSVTDKYLGAIKNRKALSKYAPPYRLHLGCGTIKIEGFCSVDALRTRAVDVVGDIRHLADFSNDCASEIYACHVLEHFGHDEILPILHRWFDVLRPGGILRISVPDIDKIVAIYARNPAHFNTPGNAPWIGLIYGGQTTPYDYHKTGFNYCWLKYLLENCGFESCEQYPHEPHFAGIADSSLAREPFGEFVSLNVIAKKPITPSKMN